MNKAEREAFKKMIFEILLIFAIIHVIVLVLILLPRDFTRPIRRVLANVLKGFWVASSRLFSLGHQVMWQKGNGE